MPDNTGTIEREIFIALPPEEVFRYLVEPALMARWIGLSHELEPRPGGRFRVEVSDGNIASGHYVEVVRPRRVAFSWGWESQDAELCVLPPGPLWLRSTCKPRIAARCCGSGTAVYRPILPVATANVGRTTSVNFRPRQPLKQASEITSHMEDRRWKRGPFSSRPLSELPRWMSTKC
jgi:uncharacterized protein YndB with AHSA1/START domain